MALTAQRIADDPALHDLIQRQSVGFSYMVEAQPRLSAVFATQQRWLMAHIGLALYFRREAGSIGFNFTRFLDAVRLRGVASRNTADAFIKEMLNYNMVLYAPEVQDKRARPIEPAPSSLQAVSGWLLLHLATLDALDGGSRGEKFLAEPGALARVQPYICDGLLASEEVTKPQDTFSLFTWLNNGGIIMDRLIAGMQPSEADDPTISTNITSISQLSQSLTLSRTHLTRKLREAENLGSIGWHGKRGHSVMWVSRGFRREYLMAQAVKLSIIDAALDRGFSS